ncbi:MAG: peptide deformylase [Chloroflexi bacterium RBG_19FT_COMBO_56_12]|nr:MAG: peptide deformylase [Chloroflexi bacterium RBG_19FT_COMBO_56_12]
MSIREIVSLPQPVLRRKARKVTDFGSELQTLIDDMVETMRQAPGVGLAAPQVSESTRVIVVEFHGNEDDEESPLKLYMVVNPEITRKSTETLLGTEGCLSVPGILGDVERAEAVPVKGLNRHGQPFTIKAKGWMARIFQHEIDHLDGILFVDRAEKVWKPELKEGEKLPDNV